jgi:molecular chaperone GrpE
MAEKQVNAKETKHSDPQKQQPAVHPVVDEKEKRISDLTESLKRLQAEFENYKKRTDKEKCEFVQIASKGIIANILPIVDSFEIAMQHTDNNTEFVNGIKLIYSQLTALLESLGLKKINAVGQKFDPYKHEVLLAENHADKEDGIVIEELQKGYMLCNKVLRHSKVKICKK